MCNIVPGLASENTGKQLRCLSCERQYTLSNVLTLSNLEKSQKNAYKFQKTFIFKIFKNNAKMSAGALRRAGNCHRIFPIDFGQENSMSKTAIRIQFRRQEKKLGQENQF
jgi:hypothetical protein